jgi:hypothetical protein
LRSQRPECLCLILRPKPVCFPQTSQLAMRLPFTMKMGASNAPDEHRSIPTMA